MKKEQFYFKRMLAGGLAAFTLANFPVAAHATDFSKSHSSELSNSVNEQIMTADMDLSDLFVEGELDYAKEDADSIASLENSVAKMKDANAEVIYTLGTNGIYPDSATESYVSYDHLDGLSFDSILLTPSSQIAFLFDEDYSANLTALSYQEKLDSLHLSIGDSRAQDYLSIRVSRLRDDGDYISFSNTSDNTVFIWIPSTDTEQFVTSLKEAFLQKLDGKKLLEMSVFDSLKGYSDYCEFVHIYSENTETKENSTVNQSVKKHSKMVPIFLPLKKVF